LETGAYTLTIIIAYLLGSLPTGYLVARARGIDIRTVGSGNIGATNAMRVLGKPAGIIVFAVDILKGFAAGRWIPVLAIIFFPALAAQRENLALTAGVAAILGHVYPCWLKFKGGKGIATSAGVGLAWAPAGCGVALAAWALVLWATKYVSLASIVAAVTLPLAVWLCGGSPTMVCILAGLSALAIYKHKANMQRLLNGTENRIGAKKK
jgi:acyl phosphate:glycerol-3-phosphate acyltransferase